ncbi:MAG: CoA-binding protein [Chloroflexota bacterium]|nr:CoA-binding protein [Chloroflexota bacterium]
MPENSYLDELFHPSSVAIVGASSNPMSGGYNFTRYLVDHGFKGRIYPINPRLPEILNLKVYPNLRDIPAPKIDYVICSIPAEGVPSLLEDCNNKNVKLIHLFTGRMSETGRDEATRLEHEILGKARSLGIRILGPNCMGLYYPKLGLSFNHDLPKESGSVGGFFQSGGGAGEFVRYAALRGVRFSKIISHGNALDINETELLYYFAQDPETKIIAAYIEGVKDGRNFIQALSYATARKPVVVLKGGRGKTGSKLAFSHTASLTGSTEVWSAALKQYGATMVYDFQELVDQVVAFTFLPPVRGRKVVIAGGGGGESVVSADVWEEENFEVPDLSLKVREKLKEEVPDIWDWLRNPLDVSILQNVPLTAMNLLRMISNEDQFDILVVNMTQNDPYLRDIWLGTLAKDLLDGVLAIKEEGKPVVCIIETGEIGLSDMESWRWSAIAEIRKRIISEGIPVFPSPEKAAKALRGLVNYWVWKKHEDESL